MTTLTIDIGNTFVKYDFWNNDGLLFRETQQSPDFETISEWVRKLDIKGVIICSVRKDIEQLVENLKARTECEVIVNFNREEISKLKKIIFYNGNIGADRIAAYLGAVVQFPYEPLLIIDAGTAITLDIADKEGNYCGGNISLGLTTRMKALALSTHLLPEVNDVDLCPDFGNDTITAIQAGARNGVEGEVSYTIALAKKDFNVRWVVLTGGDADKITITHIEQKNDINYLKDKFLVGRGLNYHLRKFYFPEEFLYTKFQQNT